MPYIHVNISREITKTQRNAIKESIGKHVVVLPDKSESVTMLRIDDNTKMYYGGRSSDCVFLSIKLYMTAPYEKKKVFAQAVIKDFNSILGIESKDIYMCFDEYNNWVAKGDVV